MLETAPRTLFISDLHLCASRPHITQLLLDFLGTTARGAQALYVLGDLFEYWAGDDDLDAPHHQRVCEAFRALSDSGTQVVFMHGNRDFLIGEKFAQASGANLLADPFLTEIHGWRTLLTHGDALCTDDIEYQRFRQQVRTPAWQEAFLSQPLETRRTQIEALRMRSENEKSYKPDVIMDVNQHAVTGLLHRYNYPELLIHGHTHRPGVHRIEIEGHLCTRWVLGDWYENGNYLYCAATGCEAFQVRKIGP